MASASLLARAAAALPSGRAHPLGSGRLSLAALPGHGELVLPGRRDGAGRGGALALGTVFKAPGRDVKTACVNAGADPPSMGDEDEDKLFEREYRIRCKQFDYFLSLYTPLPKLLSKEEKAVQEKLKEIAEKCIVLVYDAMRCVPHAERQGRLGDVFWQAHRAFAVVRSRATDGRASLGMAVVIVEKLYIIPKMVSFGCRSHLPLDMKDGKKMIIPFTAPVFPSDHGVEILVFEMIDNLYAAIKKDVDAMISSDSRA